MGAGMLNSRCATRQFLAGSASLDGLSFFRVVLCK
jgi:hypothetical protein